MSQQKKKTLNFDGLDSLSVSDLSQKTSKSASAGKPLQIPVDKIMADPNQPRQDGNPGFTKQSLLEFGRELKTEGVKSPLSVKSPDENGNYIINHGERRWRAAILVDFQTLPAFIDDHYDAYNQVKENTEREDLTILEMANFIKSRQDLGETNKYISERLGMSAASVSQYSSFHTFPTEIRGLYDDGRCKDILALYELNNLNKQYPLEVSKLVKSENVSRGAVLRLKADLKAKKLAAEEAAKQPTTPPTKEDGETGPDLHAGAQPNNDSAPVQSEPDNSTSAGIANAAVVPSDQPTVTITGQRDTLNPDRPVAEGQPLTTLEKLQPAVVAQQRKVMVVYEGAIYILRTDLTPTTLNTGWIAAPGDDSDVKEVELSDVKVDSLV